MFSDLEILREQNQMFHIFRFEYDQKNSQLISSVWGFRTFLTYRNGTMGIQMVGANSKKTFSAQIPKANRSVLLVAATTFLYS